TLVEPAQRRGSAVALGCPSPLPLALHGPGHPLRPPGGWALHAGATGIRSTERHAPATRSAARTGKGPARYRTEPHRPTAERIMQKTIYVTEPDRAALSRLITSRQPAHQEVKSLVDLKEELERAVVV